MVLGVAAAALATGLAVSEWARFDQAKTARAREEALRADLSLTRDQADAALSAVIPADVVADADASVYLVMVDGTPAGTAFVVNRERGLLATAAHVVAGVKYDDAARPVEVLNQFSGKRLKVAAGRAHVGFGAFRRAVEAHQPLRGDRPLTRPVAVGVEETPFDVAVLVVDPRDPQTGANILGPALPIAADADLEAMKPGDPIAVLGFPADRVGSGQLPFSADSRAERGVVAALVAPVDTADRPRDPEIANLIIHRMATAGGSSGSPLLNAKGEVVGVHTHGHAGPGSNGDGLAQRADVVRDLLEPLREDTRLATLFRPAWRERLAAWPKAADVLPWSLFMAQTAPETAEKTLFDDLAADAEPPFEAFSEEAYFSAATKEYLVLAPDLPNDPAARNRRVSGAVTAGTRPAFEIRRSGQYYERWFKADPAKHVTIYAFDYAVNRQAGYCRVDGYWRRKGEEALQLVRGRGAFRLHLAPAAEEPADVQVVFRRAADCDPVSRTFTVGALAWAPDEPASAEPDHGAAGDAIAAAATAPRAAFRRVSCAVDGSDLYKCGDGAPTLIAVSQVHAGPATLGALPTGDMMNAAPGEPARDPAR
ncbi:MAG: serine protease [Pseudomonadota bacterium]